MWIQIFSHIWKNSKHCRTFIIFKSISECPEYFTLSFNFYLKIYKNLDFLKLGGWVQSNASLFPQKYFKFKKFLKIFWIVIVFLKCSKISKISYNFPENFIIVLNSYTFQKLRKILQEDSFQSVFLNLFSNFCPFLVILA